MVPRGLGVSSAMDLDGATVCIQTGTTTELNLADFFRSNNMSYEPVPIETNAEAQQQYLAGACDVYTTDASGLAATRASVRRPGRSCRFCPRSSRKSRSARSCVTATTNGATSCAGR
jgi:general L-amino acid transport system substrate-binding protein